MADYYIDDSPSDCDITALGAATTKVMLEYVPEDTRRCKKPNEFEKSSPPSFEVCCERGSECVAQKMFPAAIEWYEMALKVGTDNPGKELHVNACLGRLCRKAKKHRTATKCHIRQLAIARQLHDDPLIADALGDLGVSKYMQGLEHVRLGNEAKELECIDQSLAYWDEYLKIVTGLNEAPRVALGCKYKGLCLRLQPPRMEEALENLFVYQQVVKKMYDAEMDKHRLAKSLAHSCLLVGTTYGRLQASSSSLFGASQEQFDKVRTILEEYSKLADVLCSKLMKGKGYLELGKLHEPVDANLSQQYFEKSVEAFKGMSLKELGNDGAKASREAADRLALGKPSDGCSIM